MNVKRIALAAWSALGDPALDGLPPRPPTKREAAEAALSASQKARLYWHEMVSWCCVVAGLAFGAAGALLLLGEAIVLLMFACVWLQIPSLEKAWAPTLAGLRASTEGTLLPMLGPLVAPAAAWLLPLAGAMVLLWLMIQVGRLCERSNAAAMALLGDGTRPHS